MAKRLAQVLKTDIMGTIDLPALAKIVQSKGRKGDTVLAHISRKEAEMLKRRGGSGTTNPETGLPEFFDGEDFYGSYEPPVYTDTAPAPVVEAPVQETPVNLPTFAQTPEYTSPTYYGGEAPGTISGYGGSQGTFASPTGLYYETPYASEYAGGLGGEQALPAFEFAGPGARSLASQATAQGTSDLTDALRGAFAQTSDTTQPSQLAQLSPEEQKSIKDYAESGGKEAGGLLGKMGLSDLLKLGVGGIGALMGRSQQQAAIQQAAAASQQYKDAAAAAAQQYKDLAQPLIGPGYSALSQAQQGALSAANRQAFDIARARAAQASARSGGVGAVQTAMEEARMYQQLVSTQLQQAMTFIAPGNSLASAAISTTLAGQQGALGLQLQLEQQANQAAMNMYSALAKMVA